MTNNIKLYLVLVFMFPICIYCQNINENNIREFYKEKTVLGFTATSKYLWVLESNLVKTDGSNYDIYYIDEKSEGHISKYQKKPNDYDGWFSKLLFFNNTIWLANDEPRNILKIKNDTIKNYSLEKLLSGERKFARNYCVDNFGNLWFLVYSPGIGTEDINYSTHYRIFSIKNDTINVQEFPFKYKGQFYLCSFNKKLYAITLIKENSLFKTMIYLLDESMNILKTYDIEFYDKELAYRHYYANNKVYLLNNWGDLYIFSEDNEMEYRNIGTKSENICFDFVVENENIFISSLDLYKYNIQDKSIDNLDNLIEPHYGVLRNIQIFDNKLFGNYQCAGKYSCNMYTNGFEIIDLKK